MHLEQTLSKMRNMRLSTMADSMEIRINRNDHKDLSPEEFVGLLVDEEFNERRNRKLSRMIGRSNFKPEQACIENIIYKPGRGFQKSDIMQFTTDTWIKNSQNGVFHGPTGSGKTYIAEAIGNQALKMGYQAVRKRYMLLFKEIKEAKGTGQYLKYFEKLDRIKVLIIDDFAMGNITDEEMSDLMEILEDRMQKNSTILTTQFPIGKWHAQFPNPTFADAICDRFKNGSVEFKLKGDSFRKLNNTKGD